MINMINVINMINMINMIKHSKKISILNFILVMIINKKKD